MVGKVLQRFIEEMVYGIQTRGSVRLSEVVRVFNEKISLKKVIERLSLNQDHHDLSEKGGESFPRKDALRIRDDTLLNVDPTDITRK